DPEERRRRLERALAAYESSGAEHLVITGDLTEDGTDAQFRALAEVLAGARLDPREVTLTAGNHDAYRDTAAFDRALQGPLRAFAATSQPGAFTVLDDVVITPVSTVIAQPFTRAAGAIANEHLHGVTQIT